MLIQILIGQASWFVATLIISELLFIATLSLTKCKTILISIFAIICLLLSAGVGNSYSPFFNTHNYWHINETLLACFLMSLGYLYHCHESLIQRFNTPYTLFFLILFLILLKIMIWKQDLQMVLGPIMVENFYLFVLDLVLSIGFLTSLFKRFPSIKIIEWTGSHSLVYYFICGGVPLIIGILFRHLGWPYQHYYDIILPFILVYIFSTVITYIIYRWLPFLVGASS